MASCPPQLLFADTLTENLSNYEEGVLEHIQFQHPVYTSEIRVLMESAKVKFQDVVLEGRTNPSKGEIVIYGLDLNRKDKSSTFEFLARFNIDRVDKWRQLIIEKQIPTSRIIIRSDMKSLTVALIGVLARKSSTTTDAVALSSASAIPVGIDRASPCLSSMSMPNTWSPAHIASANISPLVVSGPPSLSTPATPFESVSSSEANLGFTDGNQALTETKSHAMKRRLCDQLSSDSDEDLGDIVGDTVDDFYKGDAEEFTDRFVDIDSLDDLTLRKFEFKHVRRSSVQQSIDMLRDFRFDSLRDHDILNCMDWLNELSTDTLLAVCHSMPEAIWQQFLNLMGQCIDEYFILSKTFTRPDQQKEKLRLWCNSIEIVGLLMSMDLDERRKRQVSEQDWQHKLLDLFESSMMGTPFRLRIIRSLDRSLSGKDGVLSFLASSERRPESAYNRCTLWLTNDTSSNLKNSRTVLFMTRLVSKVHFFIEAKETARISKELVKDVYSGNISKFDDCRDTKECVQWLIALVTEGFRTADECRTIDTIFRSFATIMSTIKFSSALTELPSKSSLRHISKIADDTFGRVRLDYSRDRRPLFRLLTDSELLHWLCEVCSNCGSVSVEFLDAFNDFCRELFVDLSGLEFLIENKNTLTGLARCLSRFERAATAVRLICYGVHSLSCLQRILDKKGKYEPLEILYSLYAIHPDGKIVVGNILAEKQIFTPLLEMLKYDPMDRDPNFRLIAVLLTRALTNMFKPSGRSLSLVRDFAIDLYKKLEGFTLVVTAASSKCIKECCEWLIPCTSLKCFDWTDSKLVSEDLHNLTSRTENPLKPRVAISLKLLEAMCVPQFAAEKSWTHTAAMCDFYSADGLSVLCTILERIFALFNRSWQLGLPFDPEHRNLSDCIVRSTLRLLQAMMAAMRDALNDQHKNISPVRSLFHMYCALPSCLSNYASDDEIESLRSDIVDCLLTYLMLGEVDSEEPPSKDGGWLMMLQEVCKLTLSSPQFYLAGTSLLCTILPGTLPMYCATSKLTDAVDTLTRKRFAISITPIKDGLVVLIQLLALNSNPWLQQALRQFSSQLADLSADWCMLLTRLLFDQLLEEVSPPKKDGASQQSKIYSVFASSVLSLIGALASVPSCKAAILVLIHPSFQHGSYFEKFCHMVEQFNVASEEIRHLYCQATIASMVQAICDPSITLNLERQKLANVFPSLPAMRKIVEVFVSHIGDHNQPNTSTALALVCLIQVYNEHPDGAKLVKNQLMQNEKAISSLIEKLDYKFDKDNMDYLNALSVAFEFLAVLKPREGVGISNELLRKLFKWSKGCSDHPLHGFSALLMAVVHDEKEFLEEVKNFKDVICAIADHSQWLISVLDSDHGDESFEETELELDDILDVQDPSLPDELSKQFEDRTLTTNNERYMTRPSQGCSWWVPRIQLNGLTVSTEDFEEAAEVSPFDLDSLLINYCKAKRPNLGPLQALNQEYNECFQCLESSRHRKLNDTIIATSHGPGHRNYVAPMRGFGFGRNLIGRSFFQSRSIYPFSQTMKRLFDPFRSRPQNTSRPPSMHVDEFCQIEQEQNLFGQPRNMYESTAIRQATFMARRGTARRIIPGACWNLTHEA